MRLAKNPSAFSAVPIVLVAMKKKKKTIYDNTEVSDV
jgi:hypothetical protein